MIGFFSVVFLVFFILLVVLFYFFKTRKELPKNWFEWRTEFLIQGAGLVGLFQDFAFREHNRVDLFKQPDRVAVITGGNRGIGLKIAEKLLECDMTVVMGVRDPQSAEKIVGKMVDLSTTKGKLVCEKLDVGNLSSVKDFAKKIQERFDKIDLLLNNAGIMFVPYELSPEGYESHFATNYLGHFLLSHLLLPQLKAAGKEGLNSRIVNVSSIAHFVGSINFKDINGSKRYYPATAYNQSKLAQVMFTKQLDKILKDEGAHVQVHAVHPGVVDTDLFVHCSAAEVPVLKKLFFKTPEQGSRCVLFAAIEPKLEGQGGTYLSNCVRAKIHSAATDPKQREKLFKFTCDLLDIKDFGTA